MRVNAITSIYQKPSCKMNARSNLSVNFQGNFTKAVLPAGVALATLVGAACTDKQDVKDEDERHRFMHPQGNDSNPFPNDDYIDTAY